MMYEYTDKVIRYMWKRFLRLFNQFNGLTSFDELNVLQSSKSLYEELEKITEDGLLLIAKRAYSDNKGYVVDAFSIAWLLGWLNDYNPVTKYVYIHEIERKCARFAESILANDNRAQEIEIALRYWSNMVTQYSIDITDKAVMQAYLDNAVEKVIWVTCKDERRCKECKERDNKVYDIAKVPPKPHLRCRCYLLPYWGGAE